MTIALFKSLVAISETGSFSAAADQVCVSHAAVGQQMKRLEEIFQVKLFDRSQKSPRLNQLGKALVPKAKEVIRSYETIFDDLAGDAKLIGELTLGAVPSTILGLIPKSIKQLIKSYPDLHIRVVPGLSDDLQEQVERGAVDAAVLSEPSYIPPNLEWTPFVVEKLVLLTSPDVTENDPLAILEKMPYIRHTRRSAVGILAEQWLLKHKIITNPSMEMASLENVSCMVSYNLGVSVVPNICVPDAMFTGLRKIPLGPSDIARTLGILTRSDCSKSRLVDRLLEQIKQTVSNHRIAEPL